MLNILFLEKEKPGKNKKCCEKEKHFLKKKNFPDKL
jgi:hypothetical protein